MTSTTNPTTMTAVVQSAYGLNAIEIDERPVPSARPGQLRIKVAARTVNPMDLHLATGTPGIVRLVEGFRRPKHEIPGREACGVVDQLGPGVTDFKIGQSVFGWMTGAFAEYAMAKADHVWLAPTEMTEFESAALPIADAAALQAIELGDVTGKRVVVNGASGGVGHYAVQIAKARGAHWVAGVCSSKNAVFVRGLGADQIIDYDSEELHVRAMGCGHRLHREPDRLRGPAGARRRRPMGSGW
ncbi:MAG: NAD(P)-dependent alcohol dehydrogenase [Acidimicrobiales bacterium]